MNRKLLIPVMSILMIVSVYISSCVLIKQTSQDETSHNVGKTGDNQSLGEMINENDKNGNGKITDLKIDLSSKKIVIDSGHGGIDPGKIGKDGLLEKDINLAIAVKLKDLLNKSQIDVVMTRTDDNGLYSESDANKKIADMKKRCDIINNSGADIVVSIHQNSFTGNSAKGAQVFYYKHSAKGKELAGCIQKSFVANLDETNKRVEKSDNTYYMLLHTKIPTVIAECGFLSNDKEAELLNSGEYQQMVAVAIYNGIIDYFTEYEK